MTERTIIPMKYFKLPQEVEGSGGWDLGNPTDPQGREVDNPWMFREGMPVPDPGRLKLPIGRAGLIRCIEDKASKEVEYWTPKDGRPEKVGQYRDVHGMHIDPTKVGDAKIFRTWGWTVAHIVLEEIKEALECIRTTGAKFKEV